MVTLRIETERPESRQVVLTLPPEVPPCRAQFTVSFEPPLRPTEPPFGIARQFLPYTIGAT